MRREYDSFDEEKNNRQKDRRALEGQIRSEATNQANKAARHIRRGSQLNPGEPPSSFFSTNSEVPIGDVSDATSGALKALGEFLEKGIGRSISSMAPFWKILLILLIFLVVIILLYFFISATVRLDYQLRDVDPSIVSLEQIPQTDRSLNNAAYILALLESGELSLSTNTTGAFDETYARQILKAVVNEDSARKESVTVSYEGKPWILIKDSKGNTLEEVISSMEEGEEVPDFYLKKDGELFENEYGTWQESSLSNMVLHTVLSRKDVEDTSFFRDSFADPYTLRWQAVYALCILRITENAANWELSEMDENGNPMPLTVEKLNESGAGDYFLKEADITACIDCFKPQFRYIYNPVKEGMDGHAFSYGDVSMQVYKKEDQRNEQGVAGNLLLGGRAYVFEKPVVAASFIDLGYRKIRYLPKEVNGEKIIVSRRIEETPEEWMEQLRLAAGGYFDQKRFLYLLKTLPETDDLIAEYEAVFASVSETYEDLEGSGCIGAYLRDAKVSADGSVMWYTQSELDVTKEVAVYANWDVPKKWGFKDIPDEVSTVEFVLSGMTYARPYEIMDEAERMSNEEVSIALSSMFGGEIDGCEEAFLKMQEECNLSIPFCMGIFKIEGSYGTRLGREYYNYGSVKGTQADFEEGKAILWGHSDAGGPVYMKNYKAIYGEVNYESQGFASLKEYCIYMHLKRLIYDTYFSAWNRRSAYEYCFHTKNGIQRANEIVNASEYSGCYCPVWDDLAWQCDGITPEGYERMRGGWSNKVNFYREEIERSYGYDVHASW